MKDLDKIFPGFSRIQNHLKKTTSKKPCSLIKDHSSPKVKKSTLKWSPGEHLEKVQGFAPVFAVLTCSDSTIETLKLWHKRLEERHRETGWLVVLTPLKNIRQWEGLSHILWNFHGLSPRLSWFDSPVVQLLRHNIRIIWTWLACARGVEACTQKITNELKQRNGCTCIGCHIDRQANNKVLPDANKNKPVSHTDN